VVDIKILHVSDFHFADAVRFLGRKGFLASALHRYLGPADIDIAEAVAREAFYRRNDLDGILITGDLATTGLPEDLHPANEYLEARAQVGWLSSNMRPTLAGCGLPIFILPGNHDRYRDLWGRAGGTSFDDVFSRRWSVGQGVDCFSIRKGAAGLSIIAGDFTLQRSGDCNCAGGHWGQGRAYAKLVDLMVRKTEEARTDFPNTAVIWALHFPPVFPGGRRELELLEGANVLQGSRAAGVKHLLCGHQHALERFRIVEEAGDLEVWCAGSAAQVKPSRRNWVHFLKFDISDGEVTRLSSEDHHWDGSRGSFVLSPEPMPLKPLSDYS
jgi:hypothetical protein